MLKRSARKPDLTNVAIPLATFPDIDTRWFGLPEYADLNTKGWVYLSGGVRSIVYIVILHHAPAYERNCSYHP